MIRMDVSKVNPNVNKYKNLVLNIPLLILALVISVNIYKKQANNIELLTQKRDLENKRLGLISNINTIEKNIKLYNEAINRKDITAIMGLVSTLARNSSVRIISIKPAAEKDYSTHIKYSFDLVCFSNNFHNIGRFVENLENAPEFYSVDNINILGLNSPETGVSVNLKFSTILITETKK